MKDDESINTESKIRKLVYLIAFFSVTSIYILGNIAFLIPNLRDLIGLLSFFIPNNNWFWAGQFSSEFIVAMKTVAFLLLAVRFYKIFMLKRISFYTQGVGFYMMSAGTFVLSLYYLFLAVAFGWFFLATMGGSSDGFPVGIFIGMAMRWVLFPAMILIFVGFIIVELKDIGKHRLVSKAS